MGAGTPEGQRVNYLIFLDFDGVFASSRTHLSDGGGTKIWRKFDPIAVQFLNTIHNKYDGVEYVVSSSWRKSVSDLESVGMHLLETIMATAGFTGRFNWPNWHTPDFSSSPIVECRPMEVKHILDIHKPDDYLIFDDDSWDFDGILGKDRHIRTDTHNGVTFDNMRQVLDITKKWKPKLTSLTDV